MKQLKQWLQLHTLTQKLIASLSLQSLIQARAALLSYNR
jgi:hypothetical protein